MQTLFEVSEKGLEVLETERIDRKFIAGALGAHCVDSAVFCFTDYDIILYVVEWPEPNPTKFCAIRRYCCDFTGPVFICAQNRKGAFRLLGLTPAQIQIVRDELLVEPSGLKFPLRAHYPGLPTPEEVLEMP